MAQVALTTEVEVFDVPKGTNTLPDTGQQKAELEPKLRLLPPFLTRLCL